MRRIEARIPTDEEFEGIVLSMGCDIVELITRGGDMHYLMYIGKHLVEVPAGYLWSIRETVQQEEAE